MSLESSGGASSPIQCPLCSALQPVETAFEHIDTCADSAARALAAAHPEWPASLVAAFLPGSDRALRHAKPAAEGALVREHDVSEVVPRAFISNVTVGKNAARLRALGVHTLVNCIPHDETKPLEDEELGEAGVGACCLLNMEDKMVPGYERRIRAGALAIAEARAEGKSGLVHCAMGVSRSATVMLTFLVEHYVEEAAQAAVAAAQGSTGGGNTGGGGGEGAGAAAAPVPASAAVDGAAGGALPRRKGMRLADAFLLLKAARPMVMPNGGFWAFLLELERELHGSNSVPPAMLGLLRENLQRRCE